MNKKESITDRFRKYEGIWELPNYVKPEYKYINKKEGDKMGWILKLIPFGKSLLISGVMVAAKWVIRYIVKEKMTPDLLKFISVNKKASGDLSLGIETSEFQRAAYNTNSKWDNKVADLAIVINEELYKIKNV